MASDALLVGIDFGTTNLKAIVFDTTGAIVASTSLRTPTHIPRPGWASYDPEEMWQTTAAALRSVVGQLDRPERIVGVGVASIGETGILVDSHGQPLGEAIAWFDARTKPQAQWLEEHVGRDRLFAVTGMSLQPIFSLCKLLWLREHAPDNFRRAVRWLNTADYIAYRLCGEQATDYSLGCRTLLMDIRRLQWDPGIFHDVGMDPDLFAPLVPSGACLGAVTAAAAELTGLPRTAVVAAGGHDHVCGALASGVTRAGSLLNSIGTTEGIFLPIDEPIADLDFGRQGYNQGAHTVGGYYGFGAHYTSGACIEWFRSSFAVGVDYATLIAEAEREPMGSMGVFFLPHLRLANAPYDDVKARGAFLGLTTDVSRGALFRGILEGVAMETRLTLEPLLAYTGIHKLDLIRVIGGGTRNRLLMEIKANVQQQPMHVMSIDEAVSLGGAILGGIGAGVYADVPDALAHIRYEETVVEPTAAGIDFYEAAYRDVYERIYPTLRTLNHRIHDLQQGAPHEH